MRIIITAHSESILSYLSIKYGRDISRGDSISTKIRSGRVAIEINNAHLDLSQHLGRVGITVLKFPGQKLGKIEIFFDFSRCFVTKSWEKSRTIPTLPDFGIGMAIPIYLAHGSEHVGLLSSLSSAFVKITGSVNYFFQQIQKQPSSYFPQIC